VGSLLCVITFVEYVHKTALSECLRCICRCAMEVNVLWKSGPESAVQNAGFICGLVNDRFCNSINKLLE
jgi:hypothetical protein